MGKKGTYRKMFSQHSRSKLWSETTATNLKAKRQLAAKDRTAMAKEHNKHHHRLQNDSTTRCRQKAQAELNQQITASLEQQQQKQTNNSHQTNNETSQGNSVTATAGAQNESSKENGRQQKASDQKTTDNNKYVLRQSQTSKTSIDYGKQ